MISNDDTDDIDSWNYEDATELRRPKDLHQYAITVSSRDWTVDTIVHQIQQGHIDLDPDFQRRNAWRDNRRSRLVESFILGFPVPQIVLAENPRSRGMFIVIDGKQRLMTLAGVYLPTFADYWDRRRLMGLNVLKRLNNVGLDNLLSEKAFVNDRRQLANADIRTTVITGFQDEGVLYDIFYRINTGSVPLSSQELRQVLNRGAFSKFLLNATSQKNAIWDVLRIEVPDPRLRDTELLLRLVSWRLRAEQYKGDLKPFLDSTMMKLNNAWPSSKDTIEALTDELLRGVEACVRIYGEHAGRKYKDGRYERALNRAVFEVQAYYFSFASIRKASRQKSRALVAGFERLCQTQAFLESIEATTKSIDNYKTRFDLYREMLRKTLHVPIKEFSIGGKQ